MVSSINNIIYGGQIEHRIAKNVRSLGEIILRSFDEIGDKVVLVDAVTNTEITANQLKAKSVEIARSLRELGIKEGHPVGICSENRIEFLYSVIATIILNATLVPFNPTYAEYELNHTLNLARPKVIFTSKLTVKKVTLEAQKESFVRKVVCFDEVLPSRMVLPYAEFLRLQKAPSTKPFKVNATNLTENVVIILYSSGTTGLPKGVELTQANVLTAIELQHTQKVVKQGSTILTVLPWFHAYGLISLIVYTTVGSKLVFLPRFQADQFLNCIQVNQVYPLIKLYNFQSQHYRANACLMVPPLMVFLAKNPAVDKYDLSSLQVLYCAAAPLMKDTSDAVKKRVGVSMIRQGYGLSESTACVTVQTDEHCEPGSVGTLRLEIYGKVIDTETGKTLGPNQRGELCFKGDLIMKGYVRNQKATSETIDKDGWLHTGDIGYYDNNFNFFIVDRIKEIIKYKGFQVAPAEIEAVLLNNPKIKDAAVVGAPDEMSGELPLAFVVKADTTLMKEEVIDYVAKRLSPTKRLYGGVRFLDEIPKNSSGKLLRRVLLDLVKTELKSKL